MTFSASTLMRLAPILMQALQTPYNHPGSWSDGELPLSPMFGNADTFLEMVQNRGYDPALIQAKMIGTRPDDAVMALNSLVPEMHGTSNSQIGFGSSYATNNDLKFLAQQLLKNPNVALDDTNADGSKSALMSAASIMAGQPNLTDLEVALNTSDNEISRMTNADWLADSAVDDYVGNVQNPSIELLNRARKKR